MNYSPEMINSMFISGLETQAHQKEAANMFAGYIRDKLRDVQFSRKILPAKAITNRDDGVQRSVNHDGLVYMDEIEPESGAMALTWTAMPETRYIQAKRYEIPFFRISSLEYEYTEQELLASRNPIHKIIEKNTVRDIGTIEDLRFLTLVELAVAQTGQVIKGTATNAGAASGDIELDDFVNLQNQIVNQERPARVMLINDVDYNKLIKWTSEDTGYTKKTQLVYGGDMPNAIANLRIVRTAKTSLLTEGNLYCFSSPEFLGRFFTLGNTKFFLKKEIDLISWVSWEFLALSVANAWSCSKLEIYSGASQTLPAEDTLFESNIATPPVPIPQVVTY
jgi:hypothetical protein